MGNNFNILTGKKILIIVPHEDDELNLTGGIINSNYIKKENVFVAFVTNGDYAISAKIRIREAINSLKKANINQDNIIFLGYPDQHYRENSHIYMTHSPKVLISKIKEKYNYEIFLKDMINLIEKVKPDIIFVNDLDSHPDHRATSLIFEKAMGIILKKSNEYFPKIYKGFTYPTAYLGISDYEFLNMVSTKLNKEKYTTYACVNPYYNWIDRVRIPIDKNSSNYLLLTNKFYLCLRKHRSQIIVNKANSIINSDHVFFQRNSENLCLKADITASSGNVKFINDFMFFDCENIMHGNQQELNFKDNYWFPSFNDHKKVLHIKLKDSSKIKKIVFYKSLSSKKLKVEIKIEFSNNDQDIVVLNDGLIYSYDAKTEDKIKWINIQIITNNDKVGFSEIEIFAPQKKKEEYIKILFNDNFVYNNYYFKNALNNLSIYYYDGYDSYYPDLNEFNFYKNDVKITLNELLKCSQKHYTLKACLKSNNEIYDIINVKKENNLILLKFFIETYINRLTVKLDVLSMKICNKLKRW